MMRLIIFLSMLSCLTASAQQSIELVRAEFRTFPVLNVDTSGIFYQPGPEEEMVELRFRARARSLDLYKYRGAPLLNFYRENGLNEEGVMQYRVVGQADVVANEMLIFFTEASKGNDELEFTLLALDDGPSGLPMDHVSFLNFTSIPLICRFMDSNMILQPGENTPISVEDRLEENIVIGLAITNGKTHRVVLKSNWRFNQGNRHHILLLPPYREGTFRIRAYRITEFVGESKRFNRNWTPPVLDEGD